VSPLPGWLEAPSKKVLRPTEWSHAEDGVRPLFSDEVTAAAKAVSGPRNSQPASPTPPSPSMRQQPTAPPEPPPGVSLESLNRGITALEDACADLSAQAREEVLTLALMIAKEILGAEPVQDLQPIAAAVREALLPLHAANSVKVHVHPRHAEALAEASLRTIDGSLVTIVLDEHLSPLDVVVESNIGRADATVEARLKQMERRLRAALGGRAP
jgi:flagellar biosynthesis/type III secretory pathway protein FliH